MKQTFQSFSMDIRRAFGSVSFFLAIVGVCLVYYAGARSEMSSGDILLLFGYATEASGFNQLIILFLVLPYTTSFCIDWNTKYIRSAVIRMGSGRYAVSKIIACALSSGIAVALGIILFITTLALKVPLVSTMQAEYQNFVGGGLLLNGHYIMYFAVYVYLAFLSGAFWSVVGLCASAYIPNKFVALFTPFIGYYVICNVTSRFPIWLQLSKITRGCCVINNTFISLMYATLLFIVLIVGVGFLFVRATKRRLYNE